MRRVEASAWVEDVLDTLTPAEQIIFKKACGMGLTQRETGAVMGKSRAWVQDVESRALAKVRAVLEPMEACV